MSERLSIQDIQSLYDLKNALGHFASGTQENLRAAEAEISRVQEELARRVEHWRKEAERAKHQLDQAQQGLRRCEASGYRDENGYYCQPNCSREAEMVREAEGHLRTCEENLKVTRAWQSRVTQAVSEYQRESRRLGDMIAGHAEKAQASLAKTAAKYAAAGEAANLVGISSLAVPQSGATAGSIPTPQSSSTIESRQSITWAEHKAILKKIDDGQTITLDELKRVRLPISDLQSGTLVEDTRWIQDLIDNERYTEVMRDSREAQDLKDAILATLKALNYWKSRS